MKKLFAVLFLAALCAPAFAVNNRTVTLDQVVTSAAGYKLYCGTTTNDPATFSKTPVFDQVGGGVFSRAVAFPDNVTFCVLRAYAVGGLEGLSSVVVSVVQPGAPVIHITTIDTKIDTFTQDASGKYQLVDSQTTHSVDLVSALK